MFNYNKKIKVPYKQDVLMEALTFFFYNNNNIDVMLPIVSGNSKISLRIIDWFVTNYSKKKNTSLLRSNCSETEDIKQFLVFLNYKAQLKSYTKKQFDPFCRRERINFYYDINNNNKYIETTVGQLNFFRWAIKNNVIEYINDNIDDIEKDMNSSLRKNGYKKKNLKGNRRRRQELSVSASKSVNKHIINVLVNFD